MSCIQGRELQKYSQDPEQLRAFLYPNPVRLEPSLSSLKKNIIVLKGSLNSHLHIVGNGEKILPMIRRTGKYPPSMQVAELGNIVTTDPDEQRIGSDYTNLEVALKHYSRISARFLICAALAKETVQIDELINECFTQCFKSSDSDQKIISEDKKTQFKESVRDFVATCDGNFPKSLSNYYRWHSHWFVKFTHSFFTNSRKSNPISTDETVFSKMLEREWDAICKSPPMPTDEKVDRDTVRRALITLLESAKSEIHLLVHKQQISKRAKDIVFQGAGNISMNEFHVAYLGGEIDKIISVPQEKLDERRYSCLIAFNSGVIDQKEDLQEAVKEGNLVRAGSLGIGRIRFNQYSSSPDKVQLLSGQKRIPIKNDIKYALYGQLIARDGKVVEPHAIVNEISDLRHVFRMPSLNWNDAEGWIEKARKEVEAKAPDLMRFFSDKLEMAYKNKPRYLFGVTQKNDVWLGEHHFLINRDRLQTACEHAVDITLSDLGAPLDWITACLIGWGYTLRESRDTVIEAGDFAWDILNPTDPKLIWHPKRAYYPCTLVGIGSLKRSESDNGDLFLLAWGHRFNEDQHYTIFDCAQILCDLGAKSVLLIDEGQDVFQHHFPTICDLEAYLRGSKNNDKWSPVPPSREQIRGVLSFWTE
jgi:hypothetical protein